MENTLLRVAGALFCHDGKRAATHTDRIALNSGVAEKSIVIRPDPSLGQPGPLAHKIFIALIKKHSGYGPTTRPEVSFTKRELMRLVGRSDWGGRDSEQLDRALKEIHYAFVRTGFKAKDWFVEHSFNIFSEVYLERREQPTDPIEACTVTLARPIIASLQDGHFTCLNHTLMQELGTMGQALYMRLFFHFSNLYDGHHQKRLSFSKRYDDICGEWLGGLKLHHYQSTIERDQLGPHLRQLVDSGFLASYGITRAKNAEGFVIAFRPGSAFFTDYDRFYRRRQHSATTITFDREEQGIAESLKLAYLFIEKRRGQTQGAIPYVPSKDVQVAKELLRHVTFTQAPDFVTYALAQAKKTHFDVQTLGGLKQYLPGYLAQLEQRAERTATAAARIAQEHAIEERLAYDQFRRRKIRELFASLSAAEQGRIEAQTRAQVPQHRRRTGPLAGIMFELERDRITAERYTNRISSFDQWKRNQAGH
ncbi:MAG TPA: hypothetical protein VFA80_11525 [Xanthobacteraceae bacterium]|nr:hypothetical protein [Xanthobacteraceae bacterium]